MIRADGEIACSCEMVMACVDMSGPRTTEFREQPMRRLEHLFEQDRHLPLPEKAGRKVGLKRGRR